METVLSLCTDLQGIPAGDGSKNQLKTVNDSLIKQVCGIECFENICGTLSTPSLRRRRFLYRVYTTQTKIPPVKIFDPLLLSAG